MDTQGAEGVDIHRERNAGPPDRTGGGQVGTFAQQSGGEQRRNLAIDGGDTQSGGAGGFVAEHRPGGGRPQHGGGGVIGDPQVRGHDGAGNTGTGGGSLRRNAFGGADSHMISSIIPATPVYAY